MVDKNKIIKMIDEYILQDNINEEWVEALKVCRQSLLENESQKAEIERLKRHIKEYNFCNLLGNCLVYSKTLKDYNDMRKGLKSEAAKEFAEKLKGYAKELKIGDNIYLQVVGIGRIDNLVKEMTGDDNG